METPDVDTEVEESPEAESPSAETPQLEVDVAEADAPGGDVDTTQVDTVELEPVDAEEPTVEESVAAEETEATEESDVEADEAIPTLSASPYDMPGDWYVIHSYSGYENKVKANLETRIQSMHMEDRIFEVHIPMEDMVEFKGGKKQTVSKKVFPGYILVRMTLDDDSWYAVRNTPGVTGFVAGNAQKPTPLSRREVERFLGVQEEEEKAKPRFKPEWEVGEQVRVVTGPFADFNGVIEDMNIDQQKIVVLVNIFGRDTPVELGFEDIQKS
ncbi:MAG TPA: transcription termination/antitermination protein NusG, partial [Acidimicrobiia bacterium]|nr:transcription termination/antitermination protein NusG [Acidimicrobiia bacterium]